MFNVGVIGLGSIAEGYGNPNDPNSYCHVGGIQHSDKVRLAAVADMQPERRDNFRTKWGHVFPDVAYYDSHLAMLEAGGSASAGETPAPPLDIVAVCVRGPHHFSVVNDVIAAGPRAIFLEKPPTCSLAEMDTMVERASSPVPIPITVSYSRHWAPHVLRMQELVQGGLIGDVQTVVGYTGHSFLSFASHVTDLICQFAGYCPTAIYARGSVSGEAPEGYEPEPNVESALVDFANGVRGVHVGANGEHGGFYVDAFGTEGMARGGIYIPPFARDKSGQTIDLSQHNMPPNASVFTVAYGQIADHLAGGPLPHCTDDEFIAVHELGFGGIESVLTDKRIELPNANRTRRIWANG